MIFFVGSTMLFVLGVYQVSERGYQYTLMLTIFTSGFAVADFHVASRVGVES